MSKTVRTLVPAPVPPPLRLVRDGWGTRRELTMTEAEAFHLRAAAALAGSPTAKGRAEQAAALEEAHRNRYWREKAGAAFEIAATPLPAWACPSCGAPVGYLGNWLARAFGGASLHGCARPRRPF